MASKKFKGKTCVYCSVAGSSDTGDHVVAREFFEIDQRGNLPKVPACARCNSEKSKLETELTAILPQGARHSENLRSLWDASHARIAKNRRLQTSLATGARVTRRIQPNGLIVEEASLPIDSDKILALACLIAKGLLFHHWQVITAVDVPVLPAFMNRDGDAGMHGLMQQIRSLPHVERAGADGVVGLRPLFEETGLVELGDGAFTYEGFYSPGHGANSIWMLNFYKARLGNVGRSETTSNVYVHIPDPRVLGARKEGTSDQR